MKSDSPFAGSLHLQEIKALHLLACVLNFYRSEVTTPILKETIPETCLHWAPAGGRAEKPAARSKRLTEIIRDLLAKACQEEGPPHDEVKGTNKVLSRVSTSGTAPELTELETSLFDQLVEEFLGARSTFFAEWSLRRTGLGNETTGFRGILLVADDGSPRSVNASLLPGTFPRG